MAPKDWRKAPGAPQRFPGLPPNHPANRMPQSEQASELSSDLNVEHGQINDERMRRFPGYYATHSQHFLDVIEGQYVTKLRSGEITVEEFRDAMRNYRRSGQSGSGGSQRADEADHIERHVMARLRSWHP
jgi:hypothetical protein